MSTSLRWTTVGVGLVLAGLVSAFGCTSGDVETDSSGGAGGASTGGAGGASGGAGGASMGGAGGSPGGAGGAQFECNEELNGVGGGIYFYGCGYWLGEEDFGAPEGDSFGSLDVACGEGGASGGEGGASGHEPALKTLCETASSPSFNYTHPIHHCLAPLTEDPCASTHESKVRACVTQEPPCEVNLDVIGCTAMLEECAELTAGTCYWAMMNTGNRSGFLECFDEEVDDESCGARFMRCAWGL